MSPFGWTPSLPLCCDIVYAWPPCRNGWEEEKSEVSTHVLIFDSRTKKLKKGGWIQFASYISIILHGYILCLVWPIIDLDFNNSKHSLQILYFFPKLKFSSLNQNFYLSRLIFLHLCLGEVASNHFQNVYKVLLWLHNFQKWYILILKFLTDFLNWQELKQYQSQKIKHQKL